MFNRIEEEYKEGLRGSDGMQIEEERKVVDYLTMGGWLGVLTGLAGLVVGRGGDRFVAARPETKFNRMIGGLSRVVATGGAIALVVGAGFIGVGTKAKNIIEKVSTEKGYLV